MTVQAPGIIKSNRGLYLPGAKHGSLGPFGGGSNPAAIARAFTAQMAAGVSDLNLTVISDSTSNALDEHIALFVSQRLLPVFPAYLGEFMTFSDTLQTYDHNTNSFSSTFNEQRGALQFEDTFNRADGSAGTVTSGGQTWNANSWTISSNRAIAPAASAILQTTFATSGTKLIYEIDFVALSSGTYQFMGRVNAASDYRVFIQVTSGGVTLFVKTSAGTVNLASVSTTLTVGDTYTVKLICNGLWVGASLNGVSCGRFLTSAQNADLGSTSYYGAPVSTGIIDRISIYTLANSRVLKIYNGSIAGATISYHRTRASIMVPEQPNIVIGSLGHNNDAADDTTAKFFTSYQGLVSDIRGIFPSATIPWVATAENKRLDAGAAAAADRFATIRSGWAGQRWGFIDAYAAFDALGASLSSNLAGDLLHPIGPGSALWATVDAANFGV
ncbi:MULTISPECIES: SGNH/GDSL hydrolase family protein [unclassified Bradyrhizobium]|uniref:SGNH/GDSL hydrolase family protein n=1 Tax=unclassified Bradyrhizobium TaxID=2631580 RepID=UPI0033979913